MDYCPFVKYKNMFGEPNKGVHAYKVLGTPIVDYVLSILKFSKEKVISMLSYNCPKVGGDKSFYRKYFHPYRMEEFVSYLMFFYLQSK